MVAYYHSLRNQAKQFLQWRASANCCHLDASMKKTLLRLLYAVLVFVGSIIALAWMTQGEVAREATEWNEAKVAEVDAWRDLTPEPGTPDSSHVPVDYPLTPEEPAYPQGESPILAELVEDGLLPPLEERVGREPAVMTGPDGTGVYGGDWLRVQVGSSPSFWDTMASPSLLRGNYLGTDYIPHLAKDYEVSEDKTEYTFYLREGVRWSDGEPLTADDFLYWWEYQNRDGDGYFAFEVGGQMGRLEKVDDYTIRFRFPLPHPTFLVYAAKNQDAFVLPEHYLRPYDPDTGDEAKIAELMEISGAINRKSLFDQLLSLRNPELPRLTPWVPRSYRSNAPYIHVRNPYFWAVDEAGNQLPYMDRVVWNQKEQDYLPLTASQGGVTFQYRKLERDSYSILMAGREQNDYTVYHWLPQNANKFTLFINQDRRAPEGDAEAAAKRDLLRDKRFRQALSLAIDRQKIIDSEYDGLVEPAQIVPVEDSPFYSEALKTAFIEHDPERARELLDAAGLTERDGEGYRTVPGVDRLTFFINVNGEQAGWEPMSLVIQDWASVGVRAKLRIRSPALYGQERNLSNFDFGFQHASAGNPLFDPRFYIPNKESSQIGPAYGLWYQEGGPFGLEPESDRAKAPPEGSDLRKAMELMAAAQVEPELEEQVRLVKEVFALAAENIWTISISNLAPEVAVGRNDLRNVPKVAIGSYLFNTPSNVGPEMFYLENARTGPRTAAQIRSELANPPESRFGAVAAEGGDLESGGSIAAGPLILLLMLVGMILVGIRKPFVLRRLLIMIPTLIIISLAIFTIIQLPPGSFIETKILVLEQEGDQAAIEQIEELRESFWLDEPWIERYARWSGLYWFTSFESKDTGLLQGDFGRSMETLTNVNKMINERLLLTMAISAGTILFTWVVAFPIGVLSAVRQYSVADYTFTVIGFLGMSIPNFLLALLLSYWGSTFFNADLTGLFSAEYIGQEHWSWGKFLDLLAHIWIPIVVLGTSGTLGMIRVVRNNLLDELKKPYVVTARAKGVRPGKLLFKYPVRMALNPFISGIGGIFPALVSGGAIVAIVLSLPTVGPLLLSSLMAEDFYMAGSLLMLLSLLSILGVLFSDILLMALDPRIRMEK